MARAPQSRRGRRSGRPWRTGAALLTLAVTLTVALPADGVPQNAEAPVPEPAPDLVPSQIAVAFDPSHPGRPVPREFLGLSFELSSARQLAEYGTQGNLPALLRSLGPGLLRLGGASADTRVAWTDSHTPRPPWASHVLDMSDLRGLRSLAARSGWRILLTIGLAHYDARAAAREAVAARSALGPWLAAIEVGNEPDSYGHHGLRAAAWSASEYERQVSAYRLAIARAAPGLPLAGPGVSGSLAFERWGPAEIRRQHPALLTGHHYPLRCDSVPAPSIEALLSERTRQEEARSLARYLTVSRASATPFRMDETNTVSCGGRPGISNTFASALWAVSYIAQTMAKGVSGINFQGNPANCLGYSPVCAPTPARLAGGALRAQPEWYALLLAKALVGDRPLPTRVLSTQDPSVSVSALRTRAGGLHFVIVEDDPSGATIKLRVGSRYGSASVMTLNASSPAAESRIAFGGSAVAADGSWREPSHPRSVPVQAGVVTLPVAPSSAALVTVAPAAGG